MLKSNKKYIICVILLSFAVSIVFELLFFNRSVLKRNTLKSAEIVEMNDIEKEGNYYKTTSKKSYIIIKTDDNDNYVNKLNFDYDANSNFKWSMQYNLKKEKDKIENISSSLIKKAVRNVNLNTNFIKINFYSKNVKVKDFMINNKIYINWSRILFIFILITITMIIIKYYKYFYKNLDKAFLLIALTAGSVMMLSSSKIINSYLDDRTHLMYSYSLFNSQDVKLSPAVMTLEAVEDVSINLFTTREEQKYLYQYLNSIHDNNLTIQINNYSAKYNKLVFMPFNLGISIGKMLNLDFISTLLLARIINFLCYVLLIYFAIRICKTSEKLVFLLGLAVSRMFCAIEFSYDPTIIAGFILAIATYLRILEEKELNTKYVIIFILSVIWSSLAKAIYCPFLLLLLFIPKEKFVSKKQMVKFKSLIVFLTLIILSTFVLPTLLGSAQPDIRGGNTSITGQLSYIIHSPLAYIKMLVKHIVSNAYSYTIGNEMFINLAYYNNAIVNVGGFVYLLYIMLLLYTTFTTQLGKIKIKKPFILMVIGFYILIPTALYLVFTPVGLNFINGLQVRYFYPFVLPILLVLVPNNIKITKSSKMANFLLVYIPFFLLMIINFSIIRGTVGI